MTSLVIFDVDGVVIRRDRYFSDRLMRDYGVSAEQVMLFFKEVFPLCVVRKADLKEELPKYLSLWGWSGSVEEFLSYWFESETDVNTRLLEHIENLRTQGVGCYLYTNNERYRADYIWNTLSLKEYFDGIFASGKIGFRKSEPEFWETVFEHLGKPEKQNMIIWDDDRNDLEALKSFGFQAELYTDFDSYQYRMESLLKA